MSHSGRGWAQYFSGLKLLCSPATLNHTACAHSFNSARILALFHGGNVKAATDDGSSTSSEDSWEENSNADCASCSLWWHIASSVYLCLGWHFAIATPLFQVHTPLSLIYIPRLPLS